MDKNKAQYLQNEKYHKTTNVIRDIFGHCKKLPAQSTRKMGYCIH